MNKVLLGPIFPVAELNQPQGDALAAEIKWIEGELVRRKALYEKWKKRVERIDVYPDMPADIRTYTLEALDTYTALVASGERLRATLYAELLSQPKYQPAYHHEN